MKKFSSFLLLIIATAIAFSSCNKNEIENSSLEETEYIYPFAISNIQGAVTKAALGEDENGVYLAWEDGDIFGAYATNGSSNSNNRPSTVTVTSTGYTLGVASTVDFEAGASVYTYFPFNSAAGYDKTAAVVKIDPIQTQKPTGFDATVMPMAGIPYTTEVALPKDKTTTIGTINFVNLGSLIKFKIFSTAATTEKVKSVEFQANTNIAGNYSIDLTGIDESDASTYALTGGSETSVKTTLETPVTVGASKDEAVEVMMVIAPGSYSGDIIVSTDAKTYTFTVSSAKTFNRSMVKPLNADLSKAEEGELPVEEAWEPVTDASMFTAGETYVLLSSDKTVYMSNAEAEKNPAGATAHFDTEGNLVNVASDAKWVSSASATSGLTFKSFANSSIILRGSTSTAQGISVAGSTNIANSVDYFTLVENETLGGDNGYILRIGESTRYPGLYNGSTFRGYTIGSNGYLNSSEDIKAVILYRLIENTPKFSVTSTMDVAVGENTYTIDITRSNFTGAITVAVPDDCDWIQAENVNEGETSFDILVSANTGSSRSATLTLSGSGVESQTITINQEGNEAGTLSNPYTVAEALAIIADLESKVRPDDPVYVEGTISDVTSYNSTYSSITYYISDDGTSTSPIQVYSGKGVDGANFAALTDLAVGDKVVILGYLYNYGGTAEIYQTSTIVSIEKVSRYTVTCETVENGSISANGTTTAAAGATVTLNATPDSGYAFGEWTVTDANNNPIIVDNNTFTMPASNVSVSATFAQSSSDKTVISINFTSTDQRPGTFPTSSSSAGKTATEYTIAGYPFTFYAATAYYWSSYLLIGKKGSYILFPAISDKKLTNVSFTTTSGISASVVADVMSADGETSIYGNTSALGQSATKSWDLTNTEVNTSYRLQVTSAHNAQFASLTLTYE